MTRRCGGRTMHRTLRAHPAPKQKIRPRQCFRCLPTWSGPGRVARRLFRPRHRQIRPGQLPRRPPSPPLRHCPVRRRPVYRRRSVHRRRSLRQRRLVRQPHSLHQQPHHQRPRRPGSRFRLLASRCTSTPHPPGRRRVHQIPQPCRLLPRPVVECLVVECLVVVGLVVLGPAAGCPPTPRPGPLRPGMLRPGMLRLVLLPRRRLTGWPRPPYRRRATPGPGPSARPRSALGRPPLVRCRQRRPAARN